MSRRATAGTVAANMRFRALVCGLLAPCALAQGATSTFSARHPELANLSSWRQIRDADTPAAAPRGAFPLGNGQCFGCLGLGATAATLEGLCGPVYATADGRSSDFGAQSFALSVEGQEVTLPWHSVARVRSTNVVVTEERNADGLSLATWNFLAPESPRLHRVAVVTNRSGRPLRAVALRARLSAAVADGGTRLRATAPGTGAQLTAAFHRGTVRDGSLVYDLGSLADGASAEALLTLHFAAEVAASTPPPTLELAERDLADHLAWWRHRLADTATVVSEPPTFADLFEDWKVLLLVQRDATSGLFAPLLWQRRCEVRDLSGPLLLCLRYNLWADARAMLRAVAAATARLGALPQTLPLGTAWQVADLAQVDWRQTTIPPGGLGSLYVLWHAWYRRGSGDLTLARECRGLLGRCLDGQPFTADGLQALPDLAPAAELLEQLPSAGALLAHAPWAGRTSFSLEANALYAVAWLALGELELALDPKTGNAAGLGPAPASAGPSRIAPDALRKATEVALLTERRFWSETDGRFAPALTPFGQAPHRSAFADLNLRLPWYGWTFASQDRNRKNLRGTLRELWCASDATRVGLTSTVRHATGETLPLLLYSLADLDDHRRDSAASELLRQAAPAGGYSRCRDDAGHPIPAPGDAQLDHCQPGPSGIAIDALCFAFTGMRSATVPGWDDAQQARFQPRLPPGATRLEFRDVRRDGRHLTLTMSQALGTLDTEAIALQEQRIASGQLAAVDRKDPEALHPRFTYQVTMHNPPPDERHLVCAVDLGGDTRIRYLAESLPSFGDTCDPPLDPMNHWPAATTPARTPEPPPSSPTLLLTARGDASRRFAGLACRIVDAGQPWRPEELAALLTGSGADRLVVDVGVLEGGPLTGKPLGYWVTPELAQALEWFRQPGRRLEMPQFVVEWSARDAAGSALELANHAHGMVSVRGVARPATWTATTRLLVANPASGVLRVGSAGPIRVQLDGSTVLQMPGFGRTAADQAEAQVSLTPGHHRLEVTLERSSGGPEAAFFLRLCGSDGLPLSGVTAERP